MEHTLFQRQGGSGNDVLHRPNLVGLSIPRDQSLMSLRDIQDVALEFALLKPGIRRIHAHPVSIAQAVARRLSLSIPVKIFEVKKGDVTVLELCRFTYIRKFPTPPPPILSQNACSILGMFYFGQKVF